MQHSYALLPRLWQWLRRWRHRKGYGIHSPFAFQLVTGVIYCREAYYAYAPLAAQRKQWAGQLSEQDDQLLFRLANHQQARRILLVGSQMERPAAYVQAARPHAEVECIGHLHDLGEALQLYDMVVVGHPIETALHSIESLCPLNTPPRESGLLVLCGIHTSAESRALWERLCQSPALSVTFDLHRFGLAYLRPKLQVQHYLINYF